VTTAQKLRCQVTRLIDHGEHVYTVDLCPERPAPRFRPGQFLHLALDEYDPSGFWPESRVFSIASSPAERERLRISYSVQGRFTARMERELAEGSRVWVKLPYGEFVIEDSSDVVLFAGGTGITAFTAFLNGLTPVFGHSVFLAYGVRNSNLLLYKEMLDQRAAEVPQFRRCYFVEQPDAKSAQLGAKEGRLSVDAIWPTLPNPAAATFYLSGPPLMLKVLALDLHQRGIAPEAIRSDAWE
jgi:ferredoxin-NADP reductase